MSGFNSEFERRIAIVVVALLASTSFAEIQAGPPNVLIIGDSISIGYTEPTIALLKDVAAVQRVKGNCGSTDSGLKNLKNWLGDTKWDVIHFNWGLHDLCYRHPDSKVQGKRDKENGTIAVPLDRYEENLEALVQQLKATGATLIWASTTVVPEGEAGRVVGDDLKYNAVAARVMNKHGVAINDLHALSIGFGGTYSSPGNVHYNKDGSALLADHVAKAISGVLPVELQASRGGVLYQQVCIACHGADLSGGVGPSLVDAFWKNGDRPEAIFTSISKGIENTEMIAFEAIYSEEDIGALRDFIVSKQEGLRSLVRSSYAREHFAEKRFSPQLFESVESHNQKAVVENLMYLPNNFDAVARFSGKFYIAETGDYSFQVRDAGRTSIFLDGEEVFFSDTSVPKEEYSRPETHLSSGVHDIEIYHEEPKQWNAQFHALLKVNGKEDIPLMGQSLSGAEPKVIVAGGEAKVIRKKVAGISPRTLLCLLPNNVMVAFNPFEGRIEKVWKDARIDQTPSLPGRSFHASVVEGKDKEVGPFELRGKYPLRYVRAQVIGSTVEITESMNGKPYVLKISPEGASGCTIEGFSAEPIEGLTLDLPDAASVNSPADAKGNFSISL